ncbi:hypothetical protein LTS17_000750 [Exophiala oligosperma]
MPPSTTRHIIRTRDAALSDTLCEYIRGYNTTPTTHTPPALRTHRARRAYELAVSLFLDESDGDRVLSDARRTDFDGELIARLDAALDDSMRWAFSDEQRDRCRLLKDVVTGSTEQCALIWIHHLERLNVVDARIQEMVIMNADIENDSMRRRIGFILRRSDDEEEEIDQEENRDGPGEMAGDENNHNYNSTVDHDHDHEGDNDFNNHIDTIMDDDDCILFGKYIGEEGVEKRWVCLLCDHHPGTAYKGSFVRHLARKHGVINVRKSLRHLPHKAMA